MSSGAVCAFNGPVGEGCEACLTPASPPKELREEVEEELDELAEDAAADERDRMARRDAEGVDEPNDDVNQTGSPGSAGLRTDC